MCGARPETGTTRSRGINVLEEIFVTGRRSAGQAAIVPWKAVWGWLRKLLSLIESCSCCQLLDCGIFLLTLMEKALNYLQIKEHINLVLIKLDIF